MRSDFSLNTVCNNKFSEDFWRACQNLRVSLSKANNVLKASLDRYLNVLWAGQDSTIRTISVLRRVAKFSGDGRTRFLSREYHDPYLCMHGRLVCLFLALYVEIARAPKGV